MYGQYKSYCFHTRQTAKPPTNLVPRVSLSSGFKKKKDPGNELVVVKMSLAITVIVMWYRRYLRTYLVNDLEQKKEEGM